MDIQQIIGKTAYFGRNTFVATKNGNKVDMIVYRNTPKKFETMFSISNKEELLELSNSYLNSYTGSLDGKHREYVESTRINKNGREVPTTKIVELPRIEYFLSCFKHID